MSEQWVCLGKFSTDRWAFASTVESRKDAEEWCADHATKYGESRAFRMAEAVELPYIQSHAKLTTTEHGFESHEEPA